MNGTLKVSDPVMETVVEGLRAIPCEVGEEQTVAL